MRSILKARWFWITAFFAAINMAGLIGIIGALNRRPRGLEVEAFTPQGEVPPSACFSIQFSQAMVARDKVGSAAEPSLVKFEPGIPGSLTWEDTRTLRFQPEGPLTLATAYSAVVPRDATSLAGHSLPRDATFSFQTSPLKLERVRQTSMTPRREVTLALEFNDKVSPEEVRRHLTLGAERRGEMAFLPYFLGGRAPSRTVIVTTNPAFGKSVQVQLAKGLRGVSGPLGLPADVAQTVTIESGLAIGEVSAETREFQRPVVEVHCTQNVDAKSAAQFIQVEPAVEFSAQGSYYGLELSGNFEIGKRYRVKFLKGLKAQGGALLPKDVVRSVWIPDLPPSLRLGSQGIYLSAEGTMQLPIEAVNIAEARVTVEKVYDNNIVHYLRESWGNRRGWSEYRAARSATELGRMVGKDTVKFPSERNKVHRANVDLKGLLADERHGVFFVTAQEPKGLESPVGKLILITDLGISVKRTEAEVLVWVNALSTAAPVAGATVSVWTRGNQKVLEGATDASGIARLKGTDPTGENAPFAVAARKGDDVAVVRLEDAELDHSAFEVGGRPYLRRGYEAFVYADRGIYRPGCKVVLHAIVRGPEPEVPKDFPVQFKITRPDGRDFKTLATKLTEWGSAEVEVPLPQYALTGQYRVELGLPQGKAAIGTHAFLVEEFLPNRMKIEASAEDRRYRAGEEIAFKVKATHLLGAPAAGREVEAHCELLSSVFAHPQWKDFRFADGSKKFSPVRLPLGEGTLDENGEKVFRVKAPPELKPPSALTAVLTATVREVGGRAVTAYLSREVDLYPSYVGIARKGSGYLEAGKEARFACAVVKPDGSRVEKAELAGTVYKVLWNTVLKLDDEGRYRYVSEREEKPVAQLACSATNGEGEVAFTPAEVGQYEIRLADKAGGASANLEFHCAGAGFAPWAMEKPDRIELVADKPSYAPGETARVLLKAPFPGQALVTVEGDRIHLAQAFPMETNTKEFTFPVEASFGPNVYCTASVIRKIAPASKWAPHRAHGVVPILLNNAPRRLDVKVAAPREVRPGGPLRVDLQVADSSGAPRRAEITLAAVDEGICQLTHFQTPDPWAFFYAQRRLDVKTHDIYSLLMPETEKKVGADSAPGGDGGPGYDPRLLNPVSVARVKPVALWKSGIVTGEDGKASVTLDVPDFNGQLRLMAVAANARDYGGAAEASVVKQPLMLEASFPRFLAPGDEFTVPVTIFNNTGQTGSVELSADATGGIEFLSDAPSSAKVESGRQATVLLHARAPMAPGPASMTIAGRLGNESTATKVELAVRPPATLQTLTGSGVVEPGRPARFTIPGKWLEKTDTYSLSFSSLPTLQLGSSLSYLVHYPYGCIEQTTSSGFPLLYLGDVAAAIEPEAFSKESLETFVQASIDRLLSMQAYNGGFGCWPGYFDVYPWGSVYATHFLAEAKKAGYPVPKDNLDAALGYLDGLLSSERGEDVQLEAKAYACFVLATAGRPNGSWTYRLAEEAEKLPPYSRFHVAAALAAMKETKLAAELLASQKLPEMASKRDTGGLLHSSVREAAILLSVYLDIEPGHPNIPLLVKRLEAAMKDGRWATTQENSFALMALGKYARHLKAQQPDYKAEVLVGGKPLASFTHRDTPLLKPEALGGREIEIRLTGTGNLYYYWKAEGVPASGQIPESDSHLKARRRFLARDGKELQPGNIPHGELVIVELALTNDRPVDNLVVSDLLPAGLEIENPRLATTETFGTDAEPSAPEPKGETEVEAEGGEELVVMPRAVIAHAGRPPRPGPSGLVPDRVEMRDDRLILFANLRSAETLRYRYVCRAVTRGRFTLPPLTASAMYDPAISSTHGAGTLEIR